MFRRSIKRQLLAMVAFLMLQQTVAQSIQWDEQGKGFYQNEPEGIVYYTLPDLRREVILSTAALKPHKDSMPLKVASFTVSHNRKKLLLFTNTRKVWRLRTKGDYWVADLQKNRLQQLGRGYAAGTLMFAKFSPDATKVAYVHEYNLYVEDIQTGKITPLTIGGNRKLIYGTFDWAYEEEFFCRDGFRWSPDGKQIAFWRIEAAQTRDYFMIHQTDSIYPRIIPVEYPVAGTAPSTATIGIVRLVDRKTTWMKIPTDTVLKTYLPRMEWLPSGNGVVVQQLNRKQNTSTIFQCSKETGAAMPIYQEVDNAWIDILPLWDNDYAMGGWDWLTGGKSFLWASEKDGWRHLYRIGLDGKSEQLITRGAFDVMDIACVDTASNWLYFHASPQNATQRYLYRCRLDGSTLPERISPERQQGTHRYDLAPGGSYAIHSFTNHHVEPVQELIALPSHTSVGGADAVDAAIRTQGRSKTGVEFFNIKTVEGVTMDGWIKKPAGFDSTKKYPVVFLVYTEPWGQNVKDEFGVADNDLYAGDMAADGYIYVSIDNRGTPVPKGREWRKCIYRNIGQRNIRDQALAAQEVLQWPFVDKDRIAVWGWSGGGSATLNLMFQYPSIYKTGIAIAAVGNQLTYDNIYQERYMGLPQENVEDFIKGSPITHAKGLTGNLLYIHGTGDDNVHYNNAEMLINQLILHQKQFQMMAYPNRTHSISEGEGTRAHLSQLYTEYLKAHCPPGARNR